jgi:hypothetical protein
MPKANSGHSITVRSDSTPNREKRLRRQARKLGLRLCKNNFPWIRADYGDQYHLVDDRNSVVMGAATRAFDASLNDVEAYLAKLPAPVAPAARCPRDPNYKSPTNRQYADIQGAVSTSIINALFNGTGDIRLYWHGEVVGSLGIEPLFYHGKALPLALVQLDMGEESVFVGYVTRSPVEPHRTSTRLYDGSTFVHFDFAFASEEEAADELLEWEQQAA